jgi:hypothetical protein
MDDELLESADDERVIEEEAEEAEDEDQALGLEAAAEELAAEADPSLAVNVPLYGSHNVIYNGSVSQTLPNGVQESCSFSFRYGNYGVGYTQIRMGAAPGCGRVRTVVYAGDDAGLYEASAQTTYSYTWIQATAPAGLIFNAYYCVELWSWGSMTFSYNAVTNTRSSLVLHPGEICY